MEYNVSNITIKVEYYDNFTSSELATVYSSEEFKKRLEETFADCLNSEIRNLKLTYCIHTLPF